MNASKTIIINAARLNSREVLEQVSREAAGTNNSSWTNNVNFNLEVGDLVNVEHTAINLNGVSASSTVEITGESNDFNSNIDNVVGLEFQNYICANGYDAVALPYVGFTNLNYGFQNPDNTKDIIGNGVNAYNAPNQPMMISQNVINANYMNPDYGGPIIGQNQFRFNYSDPGSAIDGHLRDPAHTRTSYALPFSENSGNMDYVYNGKKFVKLSTSYKGPYRSAGGYSESDGVFYDTADACVSFNSKIIVDLPAPLYETPTVIANYINVKFHETIPLESVEEGSVIPVLPDGTIIPHVSGPLMKIINCNGEGVGVTDNTRGWGQMCVADFDKWQSIHQMMRCSLAFNGLVKFEQNNDDYSFPRPVLILPGRGMRQNWKHGIGSATQTNEIKGFFPRVSKTFSYTFVEANNFDNNRHETVTARYTILPKYYLVTTNIEYTTENVARINTWFKLKEKYNGTKSNLTDQQSDLENWSVQADLGSSRDGMNTNDRAEGIYGVPTAGGTSAPYGDKTRQLAMGNFQNNSAEYAYSMAIDPYDIYQTDRLSDVGRSYTTPRSDFPSISYQQSGTRQEPGVGYLPLVWQMRSIQTDVPHRFKDNINKNCSMSIFSKMLPDYESKFRTNNFPDASKALTDYTYEGVGEFVVNIKGSDLQTHLSGDVGVYGCPNSQAYGSVTNFYDIGRDADRPTYWTCQYNSANDEFHRNRLQTAYKFFFKVSLGTDDQLTYGQYNFSTWSHGSNTFVKQPRIYLYNYFNLNFKPGTPDLSIETYNDENGQSQTIDLSRNDQFIYVEEAPNPGDPFAIYVLQISHTADRPDGGLNVFATHSTNNPHFQGSFYDYANNLDARQMIIQTNNTGSDGLGNPLDLQPTLSSYGNESLNNVYPFLRDIDSAVCCSFLLYHDSGTFSESGTANIDPDYALPSLYTSLFWGLSPSFMDSPAMWCLNSQKTDSSDAPVASNSICNYSMLGANDPTMIFDASRSRTTLYNLHTQTQLGVDMVPGINIIDPPAAGDPPNLVVENLGNPIIRFNDTGFTYMGFFEFENPITQQSPPFDTIVWKTPHRNIGRNTSTSGLSIVGIYGQQSGDVASSLDQMTEITSDTLFFNSLLYKLGFSYTDLIPQTGLAQNWHDTSVQNSDLVKDDAKKTKPLSTNAALTIADQPAMSLQDKLRNPAAVGLATYKLGLPGKMTLNVDGSTSTQIIASHLPIKSDFPFYEVYTDLVNTDYFSKEVAMNIVATVPKYFVGGEWIYSQATNYQYAVTFPRNINSVKTEIRTNGKLASINDNSVVVYKISRNFVIPDGQKILQDVEKEEGAEQKN
tara:strand:+ start:258 stop:4193 length:3936 start_codon:yes stop_codon:yes gene_type:complete